MQIKKADPSDRPFFDLRHVAVISLLEEIVFVSDFTEEGRTYEDCIKCREILLNKGIDEAIIYSYEATMNHIDGSNPHPLQIEVLKSYKEKIKNA